MLSVLFIFVVLALFLSIAGWVLFLVLSMDAVYREAKEQVWTVRYRLRQRHGSKKLLSVEEEEFLVDEMWEDQAVIMWRDGRELSAIELIQRETNASFEEARIKLLKMEQE